MAVIEQTVRDLRHAMRTLARMPLAAAVIVLSLGIGIGANTVVFSWIQSRVLNPLPGVRDIDRYLLIEPVADAGSYPGSSWLEYRDLQERLEAFEQIFAFRTVSLNVGVAGELERTSAVLISGNYFDALGLQPAAGRFLTRDDVARAGGEPVLVISHDYWMTRYGGARDVIGRTIRVNDHELTIVGVAPDQFQGTVIGMYFDLWVPATLAPVLLNGSRELEERAARGYQLVGKLTAGANAAQARTQFESALRELAQRFPESTQGMRAETLAFWQAPRGPQRMLVRSLVVLQGIMLFLLLAVCGNTATLLLARVSARQQEVGVRLAVGAEPRRVVRLLLTENLLLAFCGAALGIALGFWGTTALRAVPLSTGFPVRIQSSVDLTTLIAAVLLACACALIFGAAPAMQLARVDPVRALRSGTRTTAGGWTRRAIMGVQVALALVVLIAAGVFYKSLRNTRDTDPGFVRDGVLLAQYDLTIKNATPSQARDFTRRTLDALRAIPAIESVAISQSVPLDIHGLPMRQFTVEGRARLDGALDRAPTNVVTPGYFRTMGIPLVAGRDFVELGDTSTAPQVIVNEEFVRRYLGDAEPLGRRVTTSGRAYVIAGVARDSKYDAFDEPPTPFIYFSYRDRPASIGQIHVRAASADEATLAADLRRVVAAIDPSLPLYNIRTLSDHIEANLGLRKIPARMFVVLGPLMLALAAIGIYAVVAYTVAQRRAEIGVRLALGATAGGVVARIVGDTLWVVGAGAVAGWTLAFAAYRQLSTQPLDIPVFLLVPAALLFVAGLAAWVPAQRASAIDPVVTLRD